MNDDDLGKKLDRLLKVMARLRGDHGCPCDREQTHASLKPCLIEETYELLEALDQPDPRKIREELGDVLLQVVFHSQIGAEENRFTFPEVVSELTEKIIRRHPYVFGGESVPEDTAAALKQRLRIKAQERAADGSASALAGVPRSMPALARAQSVARRASHVGFDWPSIDPVWGKIAEELAELKTAVGSGDPIRIGEELGDLLFSMVNLARFLDVEAEQALSQTIDRFTRRFKHVEAGVRAAGKTLEQSSLEEMDSFWEDAKAKEREGKLP